MPYASLASRATPAGPSTLPKATPSPRRRKKRPRTASGTPDARLAPAQSAINVIGRPEASENVLSAEDVTRALLGDHARKEGQEKVRKPRDKRRKRDREGVEKEQEVNQEQEVNKEQHSQPPVDAPPPEASNATIALDVVKDDPVQVADEVDDDSVEPPKPAVLTIASKRDRTESKARLQAEIAAKARAKEERNQEVRESREAVAQAQARDEEAKKVEADLRSRIQELEGEVKAKEKEAEANERVGLRPLRVFITWFRSPTAYRTPFADQIAADSDLTYRTKICPICRTNVFSAPVRSFVLQSILDALNVRHPKPSQSQDRFPWTLTFPPNQESYVHEDDGIIRCPQCHCEVVYGECEGCGTQFSDNGMGEEGASQLGDLLALDHMIDINEMGPDSEDGNNSDDLSDADSAMSGSSTNVPIPRGLARALRRAGRVSRNRAVVNDSDDSPSDSDGGSGHLRNRFVDDEADEDSDASSDGALPRVPVRRPRPHDRSSAHRGIRTAMQILEESNEGEAGEDDDNESYESSFIDDDAHESAAASDGDDILDDVSEGSHRDPGDQQEEASEDELSADEPTPQELRRRRAARFGPPTVGTNAEEAREAPASRSSQRRLPRVVHDSDDE
ncbi:E3 ubiquitin ligase [Cryptotrichosporon argae]